MKKTLWIVLVLALAGGAWWGLKKRSAAGQEVSWKRAWVSRGDITLGAQATGNVQPQNRVAIHPPVAGRMEKILVREGDWVKKGQTLAWMSNSDRASLLDAARAKGPEELARWEDFYKATPLVSPISGTLILRNAETGQNVTSSDTPLVVSDRLIVKAQVDETDIAQVKVGQRVLLSLDAYPDEKVEARVNRIAYEARTVSNVTIYDVDVLPAKVPAYMRSGMTANALFITEQRRGVLTLPAEAIQKGEKGSFVYVPARGKDEAKAGQAAGPGEGKRERRRKREQGAGPDPGQGQAAPQERPDRASMPEPVTKAVETGLSDGTAVELLSGLAEGDRVLIRQSALPKVAGGSSPLTMGRPQQRAPRAAR